MIKSSSFSRYDVVRSCPFKGYLKFVEKVPEPEPEGRKESPLERGSRIHTYAEHYIQGKIETLPPDLMIYQNQFEIARRLYKENYVETELAIGLDRSWNRVASDDFKNCVYRCIIDLYVRPNDEQCLIVDFKTGKRKNKQVIHSEQLMEYAAVVAAIDPDIQEIKGEIWYLDEGGEELTINMDRAEALEYNKVVRERTMEVLTMTQFPAYPTYKNCLYCPYKKGMVGRGKHAFPGTGHCTQNVN